MPFSDPFRVWPYWLERQMGPENPEFVPGTAGAELVNLTHRNWTTIGTLASPERATVDPRGLLSASRDGWSLDWWIGAEDRWHLPGGDAVVRQRLVGDTPVVETAMRVPGGDVLHRAYGYRSTELGPCAVVELENRTAVPFAVALAVRPYDPLGFASLRTIDLDDRTVVVNDHPAIVFPREPAHTVQGTRADGDCAETLLAGRARPGWAGPVRCEDGWATAAFVFPLAHTALLQVVLPLTDGARRSGRRGARSASPVLPFPDALPTAEQVAKGWEAQTRRGLLVTLPDDRLMRAVETARAHLLLVHGGDELVAPGVELELADAAQVVTALDEWGFAAEAAQVVRAWPDLQELDGTFAGPSARHDANGALLGALGRHWALTGDAAVIDALVGPIAKAVHRLHKLITSKRVPRDPGGAGLLPVGAAVPQGGGPGAYLRDDALAVGGLRAVVDALDAADQPGVADDARRFARDLLGALDQAIERCAAPDPVGDPAGADAARPLPATPSRRVDGGIVANLELIAPIGVHPPTHPVLAATLDHIREHHVVRGAVFRGVGQAGLDPALTMLLGLAELEAGGARVGDRLAWMLEAAGPTITWPSAVHPQTGGGSAGAPQDPAALALFLRVVRHLLVRETAGTATGEAHGPGAPVTGLALLTHVPAGWLGQSIDVRDAPTALGTLSYSIRWHADRPALLWELAPHAHLDPATTPLSITVPGLDPTWHTTEWRGEALLAPVAPPAPPGAAATGPGPAARDDDAAPGEGLPPADAGPAAEVAPVVPPDAAATGPEGGSFT